MLEANTEQIHFQTTYINFTNAHAYTQNSILSMPPYAITFMTAASYFAKNVYIGDGTLERVGNFVPPHEENTHV